MPFDPPTPGTSDARAGTFHACMLDPAMQHAGDSRAASSHGEQVASSQQPPAAFSLQEAAGILGISLNTLRRRIDAGQVNAEKIERPQGHIWRVYLDGVQHPPAEPRQHAEQDAASAFHGNDASTLPQPAALMQAEAMAAYTRSVLEPLVGALERSEGRAREAAVMIWRRGGPHGGEPPRGP